MRPDLVVFVGLQASGKTTFFEQRFAGTHTLVSKDRMSRHARDKERRQYEQVERALKTATSVVVDNTNPRRADRAPLLELARNLGARSVGYFFVPSVGESLRRNDVREGRAKVPPVAIYVSAKKLEPPRWDEGWDELYQVRIADGGFEVVPEARPAAPAAR